MSLIQTRVRVFAFDRSTAEPVLSDAANITAKWAKDYGTPTALTDTNPTEAEDGFYYFDLSAGERDVAIIGEIFPKSSSSGVQVIGDPAFFMAGGSVNVLPAVGIVSDRSPGTTISPVVGETISQSITLYATDGTTPVSLAGKTLAIVFETLQGADVAVVANANITVSGTSSNVVTFAYPSAVTVSERTLRFAIKDAAAPLAEYLKGLCNVTSGPRVD